MNMTFVLTATSAGLLSLTACQKTDERATAIDPGTRIDTVNAAQDAMSAVVGATSAATVGQASTKAFVIHAVIGSAYAVQAGRLAEARGRSAEVRTFGRWMVKDHTAATSRMRRLLTGADLTAPTGLDERRKGLINNLSAAHRDDFDAVYLSQQEAAHEEALILMQGYARNGDDIALMEEAARAVPMIQDHLRHVRRIRAGRHPER